MAKIELFHANVDGSTGSRQADIALTDDLLFRIPLPSHLAAQPEHPFVEGHSAKEAKDAYEELSENYSRRRLAAGNETSLLLKAPIKEGEFGLMLGLSLRRVVTYSDGDGVIHVVEKRDDGSIGDEVEFENGRLLPDTPAVEAKARALIESLRTASTIMNDFLRTDDPEAFLLKINDDWTQTEKIGDNAADVGKESSSQSEHDEL